MTARTLRLVLPFGICIAAWVAACGSSSGSNFTDTSSGGTPDGGTSTCGFCTTNGDGGTSSGSSGTSSGDAAVTGDLRIDPPTVTVTATGTLGNLTGTQSFTAYLGTSATPVTADWSVDDAGIGAITSAGGFSAAQFAGTTTVRARVGNLTALATVNVIFKIEEDFANLSDGTKAALRSGGSVDNANFRWLYPYDKTVFPRGLLAPKLMFGGAAPTAFFVRLSSKNVDYSGFYPGDGGNGTTVPRVVVSEDWWTTITKSVGVSDPVTIQVTKIDGTNVTGPIGETWNVAQGSLRGSVFYNTYNSTLVKASGASGAIMRLKPGSQVEVYIGQTTVSSVGNTTPTTSTCTVCHSVSANGNALVAGLNWGDQGNPYDSAIFSINATGPATVRYSTNEGREMPFGGLTPDGKWLVGNATGAPSWQRGLSGLFTSHLYDATTGQLANDAFFGGTNNRLAVSPSFSPDQKHLAFGDREADANGHRISILDSDTSISPPLFTNNTALVSDSANVVGWPSFLPDSSGSLYQAGTAYDTAGGTSSAQLTHHCGDLSWVDLTTKLTSPLDHLNGYDTTGGVRACYLPFCDVADPDPNAAAGSVACNTEDAHMNYEPTVLPVAVGGYYWAVFTSRRAYGNFISKIPGASISPDGDVAFDNTQAAGSTDIKGFRKKLWVAAIDINGSPGTDISHPAFLLEGQEMPAGNMRGFWALDACHADGDSCASGDECCDGFCRSVTDSTGTHDACVPPPSGCANDSEKCTTSADCCAAPSGETCVNGFCAAPTPNAVK